MVRNGLFFCFLLLLTALSWSQDSPAHLQVFGGYSYIPSNRPVLDINQTSGESGWNAALDIDSHKLIGFTADFAEYFANFTDPGAATENDRTYAFLFGPRISAPLSRITPFGHFLLGAAHVNSNTRALSTSSSFAWDFGGGVDFRLSRHFALRGEGNYMHTHFVTGDNQLQPNVKDWHARISTGIVFRF
jgi:opacity protein-like surface antigen